jgi:hypothetical protein
MGDSFARFRAFHDLARLSALLEVSWTPRVTAEAHSQRFRFGAVTAEFQAKANDRSTVCRRRFCQRNFSRSAIARFRRIAAASMAI